MSQNKQLIADSNFVQEVSEDPYADNVPDRLRRSLGQFWKFDSDKITLDYEPLYESFSAIPYVVNYGKSMLNNYATFLQLDQEVYIKGSHIINLVDFDFGRWRDKINSLFDPTPDFSQEDHVFEFDKPLFGNELEEAVDSNFNPPFVKSSTDYNFYNQNYEQLIASEDISEAVLPNLYVFSSEKSNFDLDTELGEEPTNSDYFNFITLGEALPSNVVRPEMLTGRDGQTVKKYSGGEYFNLWSNKYFTADQDKVRDLNRKFSNIFFSADQAKLMAEHNKDAIHFPMSVKLEFSTDRSSGFVEMLSESNLLDSFMRDVVDHFNSLHRLINNSRNRANLPGDLVKAFVLFDKRSTQVSGLYKKYHYTRASIDTPVMDLTSWLEGLYDYFNAIEEDGGLLSRLDEDQFDRFTPQTSQAREVNRNNRFLTKVNNILDLENLKRPVLKSGQGLRDYVFLNSRQPLLIGKEPSNNFMGNLLLLIFTGKLRSFIQDKFRSYEQLSGGKMAHSETVFYKISKYTVESGIPSRQPIQNFFIPNSKDLDVIEFIDTQVKYGNDREYKYEVKAYNVVIGTKYRFSTPQFPNIAQPEANVKVHARPSIQIVELPLYETTTAVLDDAPLPPNINVIPFRGISNTIKFNMSSDVGSYKSMPVLLENTDFQWSFDFRRKRKLSQDEPLTYSTDDNASLFQIFRTEEPPTGYLSFNNKKIQEIYSGEFFTNGGRTASSVSYEDKIMPNKKYYYTFRTIDIHGNISNPSPVYMLEMVDDNGSVIPKIEIFKFKPSIERVPQRTMKRVIKIEPSFANTIINESKSNLPSTDGPLEFFNLDNIVLGTSEESVWGKTFKIRVTSKSTGKKVDLNVTFRTTAIKKGNF